MESERYQNRGFDDRGSHGVRSIKDAAGINDVASF